MAVAAFARRWKARDDYVGAEAAYDPDNVGEDFVVPPDAQGLFGRFGEAEVNRAREELLRAVNAARGQKLLRAHEAEQFALLRAEKVLPAVAARERKIGRAHAALAREVGQECRVLVVRVRADVEHAPRHAQTAQREFRLRRVRRRGLLRA